MLSIWRPAQDDRHLLTLSLCLFGSPDVDVHLDAITEGTRHVTLDDHAIFDVGLWFETRILELFRSVIAVLPEGPLLKVLWVAYWIVVFDHCGKLRVRQPGHETEES